MKRISIVAAIALAGALGLAGCGEGVKGDSAAGGDKAAYEAALAEAKAEQKKAAGVEGEWRDTGKTLKKAEAAAAKGDYAAAIKGAKKATFEAKMGQEQAAAEKGVGNPDYLK